MLLQVQRTVVEHVEQEYGPTEKPWTESFLYLLGRALMKFEGLDIDTNYTLVLRDIDALLNDIKGVIQMQDAEGNLVAEQRQQLGEEGEEEEKEEEEQTRVSWEEATEEEKGT